MKQTNLLFLILLISSCNLFTLEDPDEGIPIDQIITLSGEESNGDTQADGNDKIIITATLEELSDPSQTITFETDQGTFAITNTNTFSTTASERTATAILTADRDVNPDVIVSASVKEFTNTTSFSFEPAYADEIQISTNKLQVIADLQDAATISVDLFRFSGKTSLEIPVQFEVVTQDTAFGEVTPEVLSDIDGRASATLRSRSFNPGLIKVFATTPRNGGGADIRDSVLIEFIPQ